MPRRTTVRLVLLALVALATSATLADAQSAGRATAPLVTSGRRPDVGLPDIDIQVDRPSSRGNNKGKPSKWGNICGSITGDDPLGLPAFCVADNDSFGDALCQHAFSCKKSKCSTKRIHTKFIDGFRKEGLTLPEEFETSEVDGRSSKGKDFDFKIGFCVCFNGASLTVSPVERRPVTTTQFSH